MAERQPTGCLCFLRKSRKDFVRTGGCSSAADAEEEGNRDVGSLQLTVPADAAGVQQGNCPPGRDEAAPTAKPPTSAPSPQQECVTITPNIVNSDQPTAAVAGCPAAPLPAATADSLGGTQPPVYSGTARALNDSDPINGTDEAPGDTCILSTTSHVSTAYFSAGGWSQFGEDGEWLAGGPPSALLTRSMDYTTGPASPNPNGVAHDPHACSTAQPYGWQLTERQEHQCNHHQLPPPSQQKHRHSHGLSALDERGEIQQVHPSPDPHAMVHMHIADTIALERSREPQSKSSPSPVDLPATPQQPLELPVKPLIVAMQEAAETFIEPQTIHIPLSVPERREQELQHDELQHQHQQHQQELAPGGHSFNSNGSHAAITTAAVTGPNVPANGGEATERCERDAVLDKVAELYILQSRPCMACQVLLQYCKAHNVSPESLHQELHARELPKAESLTKVTQWVTDCLADIANDDGWQLIRNDELQLLYRHLPGQTVHAFRGRCIVDAPIEHLLSLCRELDLCPTWNKYCTSSTIIREISMTDLLVYISVWMPWPLNDIAFMVEANGADLLDEEGCLLICFQTPDRKVLGPDAPPPDSEKHRQMRLLAPSCMSFEPLPPKTPGGPPRAQCVVQTYVDANVRIVPPFIIAFVLKVLSPFVYAAVLKVLSSAFKSPDNPLPKRIKQRPELYGLIRRRTEAYLKSKAAADQAFKGTSAAVAPAGGRDHHS